eukprot:gene10486-8451_t
MSEPYVQHSSLPIGVVDPKVGARGPSLYATKRPHQDRWFTVAYCALSAITAVGAIVSFYARGPNQKDYTDAFYTFSLSCDIDEYKREMKVKAKVDQQNFQGGFSFLSDDVIIGICLAVGYIRLLRNSATQAAKSDFYATPPPKL